jgi:hypothetical protein
MGCEGWCSAVETIPHRAYSFSTGKGILMEPVDPFRKLLPMTPENAFASLLTPSMSGQKVGHSDIHSKQFGLMKAVVLTRAQFSRRWAICNQLISMDLVDVNEAIRVLFTAHTISGVDDIDFERADAPNCVGEYIFDTQLKLFTLVRMRNSISSSIQARLLRLGRGLGKLSRLVRYWHLKSYRNNLWYLSWPLCIFHFNPQNQFVIWAIMTSNKWAISYFRNMFEHTYALLQAVDKMTRTARRSMDTHVRHAMSRPKNATTLRRITAMLNQITTLREYGDRHLSFILISPYWWNAAPIVSETADVDLVRRPLTSVSAPDFSQSRLSGSEAEDPSGSPDKLTSPLPQSSTYDRDVTSIPDTTSRRQLVRRAPKVSSHTSEPESVPLTAQPRSTSGKARIDPEEDTEMKNASSDTETEDEDDPTAADVSAKTGLDAAPISPHAAAAIQPPVRRDDSDSSPERPPPVKKTKAVSSSDESSEAERRKHVARVTSSSRRGGARQPLKRGAKRF